MNAATRTRLQEIVDVDLVSEYRAEFKKKTDSVEYAVATLFLYIRNSFDFEGLEGYDDDGLLLAYTEQVRYQFSQYLKTIEFTNKSTKANEVFSELISLFE
jgi:predicted nucleic acid-binding protein